MASTNPSKGSGDSFQPQSDRTKERRSQASDMESPDITFASKAISDERLLALKEFLKHASSDEIAAIRKFYGENREVLKLIGLELS